MIRPFHLVVLLLVATRLDAVEIGFPADAKAILDVKRECGAKGDGVSDDTLALQTAIENCTVGGNTRFVYLPKGIYKVTKPLIFKPPGTENNWGSMVGPWIYGQDRDKTIIRLADGAAGYEDPAKPQEVIRGHWRADKAQMNADFFDRTLVNFTVDCGKNPGAIGLKFYSNNTGVMRNIRVVGNGVCGIELGWTDQNGPLLIQDVEIDGFATGIATSNILNSQTFSRVTVRNAATVGVRLTGQVVAMEKLEVSGSPLAMHVTDGAMVSLVDANFTTTGKGAGPAIRLKGATLYAQRLNTKGFKTAIEDESGGAGATGPVVAEFASAAPINLGASTPGKGLALKIKPEPAIPWETDAKKWVCANDFGAEAGDDADDSESIQKAIDEAAKIGATTVYLRGGQRYDPNWYLMKKNVIVHGSVRHVTGTGFVRMIGGGGSEADYPKDVKSFIVEGKGEGKGKDAPVVFFSHMQTFAPGTGFGIVNRSTRTVVCDTTGAAVVAEAGSTVFMTNCVGHLFQGKGSQVFIRQWDTEGELKYGPKSNTVNDGGLLWVLGMKCEHHGTKLRTINGGRSEVLSVHNYNYTGVSDDVPFFEVRDAAMSCSAYREVCFNGGWWKVPVLGVLAGKESRQPRAEWCNWTLLRCGE
jgi:hypothetical protein